MTDQAATQPPGWYPDPDEHSSQRYWDGSTWTEERREIEGSEGRSRQRFEINPFGIGLTVLGAAVAVLACFLPAAETPTPLLSGVKENTLVQQQTGIVWLLLGTLLVVSVAYRSHSRQTKTWAPIVVGALVLAAAVGLAVAPHSSVLTLYPLDAQGEAITSVPSIHAGPGIGLYVLGLGGLFTLVGGIWIRLSPPLPDEGAAARSKTAVEPEPSPPSAAIRCTLCGSFFPDRDSAVAHADSFHTELPFAEAKAGLVEIADTDPGGEAPA